MLPHRLYRRVKRPGRHAPRSRKESACSRKLAVALHIHLQPVLPSCSIICSDVLTANETFVASIWQAFDQSLRLTQPEMFDDPRAFNSCSIGRFVCVGKNLALAKLNPVTALLVSKKGIVLAPGDDGHR